MNRTVGCLLILMTPLLLYTGWVLYPPSRYEAESRRLLKEAADRHQREQMVAGNSATNAYIDPDFLPFWGRDGIELRPSSPAQDQVKNLMLFSDLAQGKDVKLETRLGEPGVKSAFDKFGRFYPKIHKVCNQPDFIVPLTRAHRPGEPQPSWISVRAIAQANAGYAEYLKLQGKTDQALDVAADTLRLASLLQCRQPSFLKAMLAAAAQSIAHSTLAMVLDGAAPSLSLEPLLKTLKNTQIPASIFVGVMENEFCQSIESLNQPNSNQPASFNWTMLLPGIWSRETRMLKNDYLSALAQLRQGQTGWGANWSPSAWFFGQHSLLAAISLPNLVPGGRHFPLLRLRQAYLHVFVGLLRHRQKTGRFPATLEQLTASGYNALDGLNLSRLVYQVNGSRMQLELSLTAQEMPQHQDWDELSKTKWELVASRHWVLHAR